MLFFFLFHFYDFFSFFNCISLYLFNLENRNPLGTYFSIYGTIFLIFIVLLGILIAMDDGMTSKEMSKQVAHRYKRSVKLPHSEKCEWLKANKEIFVRRKRDATIDPIETNERNEEFARSKRRVESALKEYSMCRKNAGNAKSCKNIYQNIVRMADEFSAKFSEMKELIENLKSDMNSVDDKYGEVTPNVIANAKKMRDRTLPRFHEDLNETNDPNTMKTVEHFLRSKQKPIDPNLSGVDTTVSTFRASNQNGKNVSPLQNGNFGRND